MAIGPLAPASKTRSRNVQVSLTSYALLPIGYPMGRFGPVALADVVYEDRRGQPYRDL
jgi:hypothetical protein